MDNTWLVFGVFIVFAYIAYRFWSGFDKRARRRRDEDDEPT